MNRTNCWVIDERFYGTKGQLIQSSLGDFYVEDKAKARAKLLTECHGPKRAYIARPATEQELLEARRSTAIGQAESESRRNATASEIGERPMEARDIKTESDLMEYFLGDS